MKSTAFLSRLAEAWQSAGAVQCCCAGKFHRLNAILLLSLLLNQISFAQGNTLLSPARQLHLEAALAARSMTLADLQFERDIAEPNYCSPLARNVLKKPLELPGLADDATATLLAGTTNAAFWSLLYTLYSLPQSNDTSNSHPVANITPFSDLSASLQQPLADFIAAQQRSIDLLHHAFRNVSLQQKTYASAALLTDALDLKNNNVLREYAPSIGLSDQLIERIINENEQLDFRDSASNRLEVAYAIDYDALLAATHTQQTAVQTLIEQFKTISEWPDRTTIITAQQERIIIGSLNDDHHTTTATLIIDPGGNDVYVDTGSANGLNERPLCTLIDLGGDDLYTGSNLLAAGSALWGVMFLVDLEGSDTYRAPACGQGAGLFGAASHTDYSGDDYYHAGSLAQGAGYAGIGILEDICGNDIYTLQSAGQAYAGVQGIGLLIDRNGNDHYIAGRTHQDYERHWQNYVSLAQGFATGMRPFSGGGTAILFDQDGNDSYTADVYGQGVSYWYALALLIDLHGHDTYRIHEYGQGAGIHLSSALLADHHGNDFYTGYSLAQGAAHDYAIGMLFDLEGNDTYTADHHAQGRAINNALALLLDDRGNDAYFARNPDSAQGAGNFAPLREYGSLALLIDLADTDSYSCGATNGAQMLRPYYGIIYDLATNRPLPDLVPRDTLPPPVYTNLTPDQLMFHATRYGNTPRKRVNKEAAKAELQSRSPAILSYLLDHLNTDNMWYAIFADNLVRETNPDMAASVLLDIVETTPDEKIRKFALFLLGYHNTPEHINRIMPHLTNETTAGATIRTLGKWQATNAVPQIIPFLTSTNERKRILAVNALHDIGDTNAIPALTPLTNDTLFTVRENVDRALDKLNSPAGN